MTVDLDAYDVRAADRLMSKVDIDPKSGCWLWTATHARNGYGMFYYRGQDRLVHRVVWEVFVGAIPTDFQIDHLCSVRLCVNPDHLEPVTAEENRARVVQPEPMTHCKRGHEFTPENSFFTRGDRCRTCLICRRASWRAAASRRRASGASPSSDPTDEAGAESPADSAPALPLEGEQ